MAEFKINRFRYNWRGNWAASTAYKRDDVVLRTGNLYFCTLQHTSTSAFATDANSYWTVMSESSAYRGTWTTATVYAVNDIVTHGGQVYKCITSHTSQTYLTDNSSAWSLYFSSVKFRGDWNTALRYRVGDAVSLSGIVYICNTEHTAAGLLETDQSKWDVYFSNIEYRGSFTPGQRYNLNDYVKFGGSIWKCTSSYTSADDSALDFNEDFWSLELPGQNYLGDWSTATGYGTGDIVKYGGILYVALRSNQGLNPSSETLDWTTLSKGFDFQGDWSEAADYKIGQVVRRGGRLYIATLDTVGIDADTETYVVGVTSAPSGEVGNQYSIDGTQYGPDLTFYTGITYRFDQTSLPNLYFPNDNITGNLNPHPLHFSADNVNGDQSTGTAYTRNVVYQLDGTAVSKDVYIRDFTISKSRTVSITVDRGTPDTLYYYCSYHENMGGTITVQQATAGVDPGLSAAWSVLTDGVRWRAGYQDNIFYSYGDLVLYNNKVYKCIVPNHSNIAESFPSNGNGFEYWSVYLEGEPDNAMERVGDLLSYGIKSDTSSLGAIPVHIGTNNQVLVIQDNDTVGYETLGEVVNYRFVATDGVDDPFLGRTPDTPWASVRYACIQAEKLTGAVVIHVATGEYVEIGPIIVPANTVILGEELRSVTIRASQAIAALANDSSYTQAALGRLRDILPDIVANIPVIPTTGNTQTQILYLQSGASSAAISMQDKIDDIIQYIQFYLDNTGTDVTVTGSNSRSIISGVHQALAVVRANYEFIAYEISSYISFAYPAYVFDPARCRRDVKGFLDAISYDVEYSGNYKSILAARWYKNAVLGSVTDDMFYLRDATGIRNCTLKGLSGTLNPPGVFELYQLPTGGAYCSLDPGWGPNDERTWITTRSPYIQGVTNLGDNCVGMKIDGNLHNGGNKSMVANDFTQVLSDGVGAWVLNNGRAELVSVFTYYCQAGYLATDGGVMRALNGNCSYGAFGAYSQDRDPTETPKTALVNTKNSQAVIASTFAGEFSNSVQILEWANAGIDYSSATFSVLGNGTGVSIEADEFRDGAVYQARIAAPGDSTNPGGGGYLLVGNNAQVGGSASTIKIASNDPNTLTEYQGMRIIITAGEGTGQYGYIQAYDDVTKIITVYKESTGTPGWDHVIPGYPLVNTFGTNTVYRIEPRPIWSAPSYLATESNMYLDLNWSSVTFGTTSASYTVTAPLGSGTSPTAASFLVNRTGRKYTVSLITTGTGYAVDDELTILGSNLGGADTENNITIRVEQINGSGSISNFSYEGTGLNGRYVAVTNSNNRTSYSLDGSTWLNGGNLPSTGNWKVTAGQNKFVAVRNGSTAAAYSSNGSSWTSATLPASRNWRAVTYGGGKFVAVADNLNSAAYSTDGITWTASTLPTVGDSTYNEWVDVAYGAGKYIAIANSNNIVAISTDGITWSSTSIIDIGDSTQLDWVSIAYGNNRFVALSSQGQSAYSFDGVDWYDGTLPTQDGSTVMNWKSLSYGQGVFLAICDTGGKTVGADANTGETNFIASSEDGIIWTGRNLVSSQVWIDAVFGNNNSSRWVIVAPNVSTMNYINLGASTKGRIIISGSNIMQQIRIWEPGSGYSSSPTLTIVDPNNTSEAYVINRIGNGVLANPSFISRGNNYATASTRTTVTGDGYADVVPVGSTITLDNVDIIPGPGAQLIFEGYPFDTYSVNTATIITTSSGNNKVEFTITPSIRDFDSFYHGQEVTIYERYSQIRITGHDFLDVGTGNFIETNYPEVDVLSAQPFNEVYETNGGRVYYTSTDQDGNFRGGELFAVEQATGIVTVSAQFFDLAGLTELTLGGVRLGGSGVVIREFSTDPTFTANSNNIIPTQRAIKAYLSNRLSQGGSEITAPSIIAGYILVGPTQISNTIGATIQVAAVVDFSGPKAGISGTLLAQQYFHSSFYVD